MSTIRSVMVGLCVVTNALAVVAGEPPRSEVPQPLLAFAKSRERIISGRVDWTRDSNVPVGDLPPATIQFVSRYARNGDWIVEQRGDQDGWTGFRRAGEGAIKAPQMYLSCDREYWYYQLTGNIATRSREPGRVLMTGQMPDLRWLGMTNDQDSLAYGPSAMWTGPRSSDVKADPPRFEWTSARRDDGRYVVRRLIDTITCEWLINPDKGWNAERITLHVDGHGKISEVVNALKKYDDGIWFPESSAYLSCGKPVVTYTINRARFNFADDPKRFTPTDIGIEPGCNVIMQGIRDRSANTIWTGERAVSSEEFGRLEKEGKVTPGPNIMRAREGRRGPYTTDENWRGYLEREHQDRLRSARRWWASLWGKYVLDFCSDNKLDDQQTAAARSVLKDCVSSAEALIKGREAELDALEDRYWQAAREKDRAALDKVTAERSAVRQPIERIFESELKPRLEALLTAEQKQARAAREAAAKSNEAAKSDAAASRESNAPSQKPAPGLPGA